jgi:hypothetical protein
VESDDAKEKDEPQKFLKDYDKLMKGKDADWVFFPDGAGIKKGASVTVKDFEGNGRGHESKDAARDGKDYMEKWLEKQGYKVVPSGGEVTVEGNVFNAWEPHGAARYWGGWAANPGVGMEIMAKDSKGIILAEIRHKARAARSGTPSRTAWKTWRRPWRRGSRESGQSGSRQSTGILLTAFHLRTKAGFPEGGPLFAVFWAWYRFQANARGLASP